MVKTAQPTGRRGALRPITLQGHALSAFVPPPLPPDPPVDVLGLIDVLGAADRAIGRLDGITTLLPDRRQFIYVYVRKEAVLSSQIEGTQSSLSDLLRFEITGEEGDTSDDLIETSNYVHALERGLEDLDTLALSLRTIRNLHAALLRSGRGASKAPGEFRRTQNWIGGGSDPRRAIFVPPHVPDMTRALSELESFLNQDRQVLPPLIAAGLAHVQFETIHPFLDGNGRVGRLLITLFLCKEKLLREPLLYLSLYFKQNRSEYYQRLQAVRETGDWEGWLRFFLTGVIETAESAFGTAMRVVEQFKADRQELVELGDRNGSLLRLHEALQKQPYLTAQSAASATGLSEPTIYKGLAVLQQVGLVEELTGRSRGRVFCYRPYLTILEEGTEPL